MNIIDSINIRSNSETRKEALKSIFAQFLQNADNDAEKYYLINIIRNVNWYWSKNMFDYFEDEINENFDENSVLIDSSKKDSSSTKNILTYLQNSINMPNNVKDLETAQTSVIKKQKIFLIDDFIGTGNTFLEVINKLEKAGYRNKRIYIVSYVCHVKGKEKIETFKSKYNEIILHFKVLEEEYTKKIKDQDIRQYIESICIRCHNIEFAFGYGHCGAMVSINGTSPNNNISLLYSDDIDDWIKLLDRDIDLIALNIRRKKIINNEKYEINRFYKDNGIEKNISLKEFKALILLYNCYGMDIELLKKFGFFATLKECNEILQSLYDKHILKDDYFVEIIDKKIIALLKKFNKYIDDTFIKEKNKKFY